MEATFGKFCKNTGRGARQIKFYESLEAHLKFRLRQHELPFARHALSRSAFSILSTTEKLLNSPLVTQLEKNAACSFLLVIAREVCGQ